MQHKMKRQMNVLLVEDNNLDAMMVERAIARIEPNAVITRAADGLAALEAINADSIPKPYFIMLDVNMPRMNGHEFLKELRARESVSESMVFMFTTSDSAKDIAKAYKERVNGYIVKPQGKAGMNSILETIQKYWNTCEPPLNAI